VSPENRDAILKRLQKASGFEQRSLPHLNYVFQDEFVRGHGKSDGFELDLYLNHELVEVRQIRGLSSEFAAETCVVEFPLG
jgi:hypothetical protein